MNKRSSTGYCDEEDTARRGGTVGCGLRGPFAKLESNAHTTGSAREP
jgi:hypothetical protein